ncbi:MAG: 3-hydroxyacyl-CoA dehydrogenase NAD-binding domain-containing protein [Thermoleophilia bacterium]
MSVPEGVPGPVAVIGAGLTGAGWAGLFAAHGRAVRVLDTDGGRARAAVERALGFVSFLVTHDLADAAVAERGLGALRAVDDPAEALADVVLVQECVAEQLAVKRAVFAEADRLAPPGALLATSSSGLSITDIQDGLPGAGRCVAAHPYNPPHLVPLVELAPGRDTEQGTMELAREFYLSVGKDPVVLTRDIPGYLSNRMSAALWREAVELVRSGVASVEDVDRAISSGPGLRWAVMGPHLLYHLGGAEGGIRGHLEHLGHVKEGMLRDLATWVSFPPDTVDVLEAGLRREIEGREPGSLERERDEALAGFLKTRAVAAGRSHRSTWPAHGSPVSAGSTSEESASEESASEESTPQPVIVDGTAGSPVDVVPGVTRTTLAAGRATTLVRFTLEPRVEIPLHRHPHEQTGYLVEGDLTIVTESGEWTVGPGDSWSVPGGAAHGARTRMGAVAVEVFAPCREDYLPGAPPRTADR